MTHSSPHGAPQGPFGSAPGQGDAHASAPGPVLPPLPGAGQTTAPTSPGVASELRSLLSPAGAATWAKFFAVVAGVGLVLAATLMMGFASSRSGSSFGLGPEFSGVGAFFMFWATILSGGLSISSAQGFGGQAQGDVSVVSITAFALIAIGVWLIARRAARREYVPGRTAGSVFLRASVEGLGVGLIVLIVAAISRFTVGEVLAVQALMPGALVWPLVVVTAASFAGRLSTRPLNPMRSVAIAPVVREVLSYFTIIFIPLIIVALVLLVFNSGSLGAGAWWLWFPLGANLAAFIFSMAQFGSAHAGGGFFGGFLDGSSSSSSWHLWDQAGQWSILIIVITVLAMIFASVFIGVRRQRAIGFAVGRVWQMPVGVLVVWVFATLVILPVSVRVGGSTSAAFSIGINADSILFVFIFAALVSLLAEVSPRIAYGMSPNLLAFLGGRRATATWVNGALGATTTPVNPFGPLPMHTVFATQNPVAPAPASFAPAVGGTPGAMNASSAPPVPSVPSVPSAPGSSDAHTLVFAPQRPASAPAHPAAPAPASAAPPPAPMAAAPITPMSKKTKRRIIASLVSVGVLALLVVGAFVTVGILNSQRDPAALVQEYFDALARGDADAASEMIDPGLRQDDRVLLTNAAYAGESKKIEVKSIETIDRGSENATVEATFSVDGERYTETFTMAPGPKEFLFLDTWKFRSGEDALMVPISLDLSSAIESVKIGDVEITDDMLSKLRDGDRQLYVYPGVYQVTYPETSDFYATVGDESLRATPGDGYSSHAYVSATVEETEALHAEVLRLVKAKAMACVTVPTNMEDYCPYALRQTDLSALGMTEEISGFEEIGSGYFRTEQGEFTTTSNPTSWNKNPTPQESSYRFSGDYEVIDGKVQLTDIYSGW